jgi:hypothetical protein
MVPLEQAEAPLGTTQLQGKLDVRSGSAPPNPRPSLKENLYWRVLLSKSCAPSILLL